MKYEFEIEARVRVEQLGTTHHGRSGVVIGHGDREGWPACTVRFPDGKSYLLAERFLRRADDNPQAAQ